MPSYAEFLKSKQRVYGGDGLSLVPQLPTPLYDWQAAIVRWTLRKGRCALFADCGLGKSFMRHQYTCRIKKVYREAR